MALQALGIFPFIYPYLLAELLAFINGHLKLIFTHIYALVTNLKNPITPTKLGYKCLPYPSLQEYLSN